MTDILLICRKPGFRRNGIAHEASKVWPADRWTDDQLRIFDDDPMFEVRSADEDEERAAEKPAEPMGEERQELIEKTIGWMDAKHFGSDGQPIVAELREFLGFLPLASEIERACLDLSKGDDPKRYGLGMRALALAAVELGDGDLTKDGLPKMAVLEKATGFKPTRDEIEALAEWRSSSASGS